VVNETLGPIGWRTALARAGEIGRKGAAAEAEPELAGAPAATAAGEAAR
jgi:hypothetical protein